MQTTLLFELLPSDVLILIVLPLEKRDLIALALASDALRDRLDSPRLAHVWHFKVHVNLEREIPSAFSFFFFFSSISRTSN
jgi:hypothetical protein